MANAKQVERTAKHGVDSSLEKQENCVVLERNASAVPRDVSNLN